MQNLPYGADWRQYHGTARIETQRVEFMEKAANTFENY